MEDSSTYDAVIQALRMLKRVRMLEGTVLIHEKILLEGDTLLSENQLSAFVREVNAIVAQFRNSKRDLDRLLLEFDGGNVLILNPRPFTICLLYSDIEKSGVIEKAADDFITKWSSSLQVQSGFDLGLPVLDPGVIDTLEIVEKAPDLSDEATEAIAPLTETTLVADAEEDVDAAAEIPPEALPEAFSETPTAPAQTPAEPDPAEVWVAFREKLENLLSKVIGRAQATRILTRELKALGVDGGDGYLTAPQFRPFGMALLKKVKDRSLRKQLETEMLAIISDHTT